MYVVWFGVEGGQECVDVVRLFREVLFVYCSVLLRSSQVYGCDRCVFCVAVVGRWGGSCDCVWVVVVLYVEVRMLPGWLRSTTLDCLGFSWRVQIATEGPWVD